MGGGTNITAPAIGGLQIQSSVYGLPIPIVWGQSRIPANLLWYGDFKAIPHTTNSGGKGGGGVTQTTYSYQSAGFFGICEGPINGIESVWAGKDITSLAALGLSLNLGAYPQGIWGYLTTNHPGQAIGYSGVAAVYSGAYTLSDSAQLPNHSFEVKGLFQYGTTGQTPKAFTVTSLSATANSTGHSFAQNQIVRTSTTGILPSPLLVGTDYYVNNPTTNTFELSLTMKPSLTTPVSSIIFNNVNTGIQFASFVSDQNPTQAIFTVTSFSATANSTGHGFTQNQIVRTTSTGILPSPLLSGASYYVNNPTTNTFELSLTAAGASLIFNNFNTGVQSAILFITGANPKDIVTDYLTNPIYGIKSTFPLDSFSSFSNYCVANGIFLSPALTSQGQASDLLSKICEICNSAPVWSEGVLKIIPYGDASVTGNGVTFTPNTTPQYDLADDDFISDGTYDPVQITRGTPADAFNQVQVQFKDRVSQYNQNIAEAKDQSNIDLFGLRPVSPLQYDYITDVGVARAVAQIQLQRVLYMRNQFTFKLSWKYARLEPMDLVTITDSVLGLARHTVRIIDVEEDEYEQLNITAEDYLANNATATAYPSQQAGGWTSTYNNDPGFCNAPLIFDAPGYLTNLGYELWIATSGGNSDWGGCQVWVSLNDSTYKQVGSMYGASRYGTLTANTPADGDPDTTSTFSVNLAVSGGALTSGSTGDANNHNTLALVGGSEVVSFSTATLTGTNAYNLSAYTRRGIYNTVNGAHNIGDSFVRLDAALFIYPYDPSLIGSTIYIKLLPFNQHLAGNYSIATVTAVPYVIQGALGYPDDVKGFTVQQTSGEVVSFSWNSVPNAYIDIAYAPQGTTDWTKFIMLTEAARGTEMTNAEVPPGAWTFGIRARDKSNKLSRNTATRDFIVKSTNISIIHDVEAIGWNGALVGLVEHYTGVLVPDSQNLASFYAGWDVFDKWVPDPVAYIQYTTPSGMDAGYDETLRVYDAVGLVLGVGQSGQPNMNSFIDTWLTGNADPNVYTPWVIGNLLMRYINGRISANIVQGALFLISNYTLNADMAPVIETPPSDIIITAPNSTLTLFPTPFHYAPFVVPVVKSPSSATSATVTSFHQNGAGLWDGAIFKIWQGSSEVSGTLTYTATGE